MKIDPNDPRLTAYALGELDDTERAEIEVLLKDDEVARREMETIRRATTAVANELRSEPCPRLAPEQITAIHERFASDNPEARAFPWWRILGWTAALGAAGVIAALLFPPVTGSLMRPRPLPLYTVTQNESAPKDNQPVNQADSLAYSVPDGMRAVAVAADEITSVGAPAKPGDRVDVLATSTDPNTHLETTRLVVPNALVLARNEDKTATQGRVGPNGVLTLGVTPEEGGSLAVANRSDRLRIVMRPAEAAGDLMADSRSPQYAFHQVAPSPAITSGQIARRDFGGDVQFNDGHALGNVGAPRSDEAQLYQEQPAGSITIYRGAQGQPLARNGFESQPDLRSKSTAGNPFFRRGRVDWSQNRTSEDDTALPPSPSAESYTHSVENSFVSVTQNPLSTFGLDVDTASYANIRRFLNQGTLPPRDAVRIEEMLNYFPYDYPAPRRNEPFALYVEMSECPWNSAHRLALIGLKAKDVAPRKLQPMNLVFLIDVSGSMADQSKLPLVKQALRLLVEQLSPRDRVAIVVYAGDSRVALRSTPGDDKAAILEVIDSLEAGGSTNGGAGIQSAYREATANFIGGGVNRVILCTDGDFNVGITDQNELTRLIQDQAKSRVFLTILGMGMGNLKDSTMQRLADKGNGNYAYIDDLDEARKVLVEQMRGTLVTVAKDAKVQIEFNPALVDSYRLIGYEKRLLRARDFNNDRKDAGEVGAGHTVTALYEIALATAPAAPGIDPLKYQPSPRTSASGELMTVELRYKEPEGSTSQLLTAPVRDTGTSWRSTSSDFRFAASVAAFGLVLRDSPYKGDANLNLVRQLAEGARGRDDNGYRSEFISLIDQARSLRGHVAPDDP